ATGGDDLVHHLLRRVAVYVVDQHAGALTGKHPRMGRAQSTAGTGNDDHPVIKNSHLLLPCSFAETAMQRCQPGERLLPAAPLQSSSIETKGLSTSRRSQSWEGRAPARPRGCRMARCCSSSWCSTLPGA